MKKIRVHDQSSDQSSFDKNGQTRATETIFTRMKIDRGISYGMDRKIFEDKFHQQWVCRDGGKIRLELGESYELEEVKEHKAQAEIN
jgi:hypothetical protein